MTATLDDNPYRAPAAELQEVTDDVGARFYVVAPRKFLWLMIGTVGFYSLYWFYRNWKLQNAIHRRYWPIARAIFAIFFTHALFREVDAALQSRRHMVGWSATGMATLYVFSVILSRVFDRMAIRDIGSPVTDLLAVAMLVPTIWSLFVAQRAINAAEGDPGGSRNEQFSAANILWLLAGAMLWLVVLLGLASVLVPSAFA